jgi:hypothetical protein
VFSISISVFWTPEDVVAVAVGTPAVARSSFDAYSWRVQIFALTLNRAM